MFDVIAVADTILRLAKARGLTITPMQLTKLAYISHGFYLANSGAPLFPNRVEAWQYGPVIPDLYRATKSLGRNPVPFGLIGPVEEAPIDGEVRDFLDVVVKKYGRLSGPQLSYLTHQSGTPWDLVYTPNERGIAISNSSIRAHYLSKLNE